MRFFGSSWHQENHTTAQICAYQKDKLEVKKDTGVNFPIPPTTGIIAGNGWTMEKSIDLGECGWKVPPTSSVMQIAQWFKVFRHFCHEA